MTAFITVHEKCTCFGEVPMSRTTVSVWVWVCVGGACSYGVRFLSMLEAGL